MIGGIVQQRMGNTIEVLDDLGCMARCWRSINTSADVIAGDRIWWQSFIGFRTRDGGGADMNIGECRPACHPAANEAEP